MTCREMKSNPETTRTGKENAEPRVGEKKDRHVVERKVCDDVSEEEKQTDDDTYWREKC